RREEDRALHRREPGPRWVGSLSSRLPAQRIGRLDDGGADRQFLVNAGSVARRIQFARRNPAYVSGAGPAMRPRSIALRTRRSGMKVGGSRERPDAIA